MVSSSPTAEKYNAPKAQELNQNGCFGQNGNYEKSCAKNLCKVNSRDTLDTTLVREYFSDEVVGEDEDGNPIYITPLVSEDSSAHIETNIYTLEDEIHKTDDIKRWKGEDGEKHEGDEDLVSSTLDDTVGEVTYHTKGKKSPVNRKEDSENSEYKNGLIKYVGKAYSKFRSLIQYVADKLRGKDREAFLEEMEEAESYSESTLVTTINDYKEKAVKEGKMKEKDKKYKSKDSKDSKDSDDSDDADSDDADSDEGGDGE